ncbi:MAG: Rpn family recombination-promoting nuclease/putative transposase, partial [Sphaerospermopsis sp. SIO1G2]|nr:Rpn family recombination-promoting nuclease/putative transposase [Sphaerospermopsis sp. SIO1G2]
EARSIARPITQYTLLETTDHILYPDSQEFQIAIVELPKFHKQVEQLENVADMWLYLLNHADDLSEVPKKMATVTEIQTAFEAAKRINLSVLELEELEKRRMYAMQEEENLAWARRDALEEGIGIGREEGIGIGREAGKRDIVRQMLARMMSPEEVAELTGVPLAEVIRIQHGR